jgi:hypothetical protein
VFEPGLFKIYIGPNSATGLTEKFELNPNWAIPLNRLSKCKHFTSYIRWNITFSKSGFYLSKAFVRHAPIA